MCDASDYAVGAKVKFLACFFRKIAVFAKQLRRRAQLPILCSPNPGTGGNLTNSGKQDDRHWKRRLGERCLGLVTGGIPVSLVTLTQKPIVTGFILVDFIELKCGFR
ncbi:hypothetical protein Bca4012_092393 [Brassica carinata]|uniref:Uncharacterized protein n=3 Tax=Brassica TaxID=3705 RepID=A0A0D3DKB3_BRAOL|nr:unnamed protein product [Brassica napus]CDY51378.1 BnaCnng20840D [Brassica napus]VDD54382.1 unnamed protein product [Brassica oleracea]